MRYYRNHTKEPETLALVVHNKKIKLSECYIFHVHGGKVGGRGKAIVDAITRVRAQRIADVTLELKKTARERVFDAVPGAPMKPPAGPLADKQIHRGTLKVVNKSADQLALGAGHFGRVYKARHKVKDVQTGKVSKSNVAVKMLHQTASDEAYLVRVATGRQCGVPPRLGFESSHPCACGRGKVGDISSEGAAARHT